MLLNLAKNETELRETVTVAWNSSEKIACTVRKQNRPSIRLWIMSSLTIINPELNGLLTYTKYVALCKVVHECPATTCMAPLSNKDKLHKVVVASKLQIIRAGHLFITQAGWHFQNASLIVSMWILSTAKRRAIPLSTHLFLWSIPGPLSLLNHAVFVAPSQQDLTHGPGPALIVRK